VYIGCVDDIELDEKPKKGFLSGLFTKREKSVNMDVRSKGMAEKPMSDDLLKLLGGAYKGPEDKNMALDYTWNDYVPIGDSYKPMSDTYKPSGYQPGQFQPLTYESPQYESASGALFGEQGKAWEDSPVFKKTGVDFLGPANEKSPLYSPTGMSDILFGNKDKTPMVTGEIPTMPMSAPPATTIPYQRVTPITQFSPSPVNIPLEQSAVIQPSVVAPPVIPQPMPTLPTQVIPPQYIKRPVGRPRLNKPPKIKRPVGRPRKYAQETQVVETQ